MSEPLSIVIFGDSKDEQVIALKCFLIKHGFCNFASGCFDAGRCPAEGEKRAGLFVVSRASVSATEMETITNESRRLAVPVLQL